MSVEEIKQGLASLSAAEKKEIALFLAFEEYTADTEYLAEMSKRLADTDPTHWLALEEVERRLDRG